MYDYKYGTTSNLHKEIEQITKIQENNKKNYSNEKRSFFKKKLFSEKPNRTKHAINRNSFELNVFQSCI